MPFVLSLPPVANFSARSREYTYAVTSPQPHLAAAMLFSPAAAVAQAAPNPNPNVGSEAQRAVSEVPATIDAEDAGEKKVQLLVGRRLMVTARKGDAEEMAQLLKLKPDVNFRDTDGTTPLQAACQVGMDG